MKIPAYTDELHSKLTSILNTLDPAHIANENIDEYSSFAGCALTTDTTTDLIEALNEAFVFLLDESYILNKEQREYILENF